MHANDTLSRHLRQRRQHLGLSLKAVALRAGTSTAALSRYEHGWNRFEIGTLRKLAAALDAELIIELRPLQETVCSLPERSRAVKALSRLFWDHPLAEADIQAHPVWVVDRILAYGGLADLHAIRRIMGANRFLDAVAQARFTSPKTRNFWEHILEMEGRKCTRKFSRNTAWNC